MQRWGGAVRAALALVVALSIVGCSSDKDEDESKPNGIEDMSVRKALREYEAAVQDWDDVWFQGTGAFRYDTGIRRVHATMIVTRKACSFTFSAKAVGEVRLKLVGKTTYVQADAKALTVGYAVPAATAAQIRGRWISQPVTDELARTCGVAQAPARVKDCKRGREGKVGTTPSIAFTCIDDGRPVTLHVATVGEPVLLRITGKDPEGPYDLRVVDHDTGYVVEAPPKGDVIALPR